MIAWISAIAVVCGVSAAIILACAGNHAGWRILSFTCFWISSILWVWYGILLDAIGLVTLNGFYCCVNIAGIVVNSILWSKE